MNVENYFNIRRFALLIKNDILKQYRTFLTAIGAVTGILLAIILLSHKSSGFWNFHLVFYPLVLFIGGFILSSFTFAELHHPQKSYVYLTLPCSILEKFVCKFLLTSIGYIIISAVLFYLFSIIAAGLNMLLFKQTFPVFNPFDEVILQNIRIYMVTQSIFLFAAVYFKKNNLIKMILSLFLLSIVCSAFATLVLRLTYWDYWDNGFLIFSNSSELGFHAEPFFRKLSQIFEFLFWWIMAPYFWILGFLRLKETEV